MRFPDKDSCERYLDYRGMKFCFERDFHMRGVADKASAFHARLEEFGLGPLV